MTSIARIERRRAKKGKPPLTDIYMKFVHKDGCLGSNKQRNKASKKK